MQNQNKSINPVIDKVYLKSCSADNLTFLNKLCETFEVTSVVPFNIVFIYKNERFFISLYDDFLTKTRLKFDLFTKIVEDDRKLNLIKLLHAHNLTERLDLIDILAALTEEQLTVISEIIELGEVVSYNNVTYILTIRFLFTIGYIEIELYLRNPDICIEFYETFKQDIKHYMLMKALSV